MAKKRVKKKNSGRLPVILTMKGSPEWKDWLERASDHCGLNISALVEQAVRKYVKSEGFAEHPPKR